MRHLRFLLSFLLLWVGSAVLCTVSAELVGTLVQDEITYNLYYDRSCAPERFAKVSKIVMEHDYAIKKKSIPFSVTKDGNMYYVGGFESNFTCNYYSITTLDLTATRLNPYVGDYQYTYGFDPCFQGDFSGMPALRYIHFYDPTTGDASLGSWRLVEGNITFASENQKKNLCVYLPYNKSEVTRAGLWKDMSSDITIVMQPYIVSEDYDLGVGFLNDYNGFYFYFGNSGPTSVVVPATTQQSNSTIFLSQIGHPYIETQVENTAMESIEFQGDASFVNISFAECLNLTQMIFDASATFGDFNLHADNVRTLIFKGNVSGLVDGAFQNAQGLEEVYFYGDLPDDFEQNAGNYFPNGGQGVTLYVNKTDAELDELKQQTYFRGTILPISASENRTISIDNEAGGTVEVYKTGQSAAVFTAPGGDVTQQSVAREGDYYAIIRPDYGRTIAAVYAIGGNAQSGMSMLTPQAEGTDGAYRVSLPGLAVGNSTYQLTVLYRERSACTITFSVVGNGSVECKAYKRVNNQSILISGSEATASEANGRYQEVRVYPDELTNGFVKFQLRQANYNTTVKVSCNGVDVTDKFVQSGLDFYGGFSTDENDASYKLGAIAPASLVFTFPSEAVTLNSTCEAPVHAYLSLRTLQGEVGVDSIVGIPSGATSMTFDRGKAIDSFSKLYLEVKGNRSLSLYCDGQELSTDKAEISTSYGETGDSTLYAFRFREVCNFCDQDVANLSIVAGDEIITDVATVRATSNSVDPRGIHVYAFDKDSDGRPTGSGQEYDTFGSIPVDKYVQVHFYICKGNPYESNPTLTVNGGAATLREVFDYTYSGNTYYRYDIPDLSVYPIWDLELTVSRWGEPRTDVVTHDVTMSDESGQAQATYSYNDAEGNVVSNPVSPYGSAFEMPKVTMDENAFVEMQVRVPEGYKLHVYSSQYEEGMIESTEPIEENGTQFVSYTFRHTTYDYRMVNQSFRIEVTESDPTVDWNVTLLGQVMVNMEFLTESETALDGGLEMRQSGIVKANGRAKKLSLWVNYEGDYGDYDYDEFWDTKEVVVKADGQDFSEYFVQNDGGYTMQEGYIPVDAQNVTNWIIGIKDKNSQTVTWSLQAKGEVPEGASANLALGDMQVAVDSEQSADNQTVDGLSDGNYGMSGAVQLPAGYAFKLQFNGEDITSEFVYDENHSKWTIAVPAADAARFNEDACLVIEFTKKPAEIIEFADANVKAICVANWDTDGDGELSKEEAAAVTTLKKDNGDGTFGDPVFKGNAEITSFEELQYFTGLTEIEAQAFRYCEKLTSVIVPRNVKVIQTEGFFHCRNLSVELPEGLTQIGIQAFGSCFYMKEIRLPESLERIERGGFESCFTIKTLYIPKNVNFINFSNGALGRMDGLISITVDPENTTYDSRNGCNGIIEKANNMLRAGCRNTKIPEGVTTIYGFSYQNFLTSIEIPASVTSISASTFRSCQRLTSVVSHIENPFAFGTDAFRGISSECVLTVPYGTKQAYIDAGWTDGSDGNTAVFKEIKELPSKYDVNEDGNVSISDVTKLVNVILGKE